MFQLCFLIVDFNVTIQLPKTIGNQLYDPQGRPRAPVIHRNDTNGRKLIQRHQNLKHKSKVCRVLCPLLKQQIQLQIVNLPKVHHGLPSNYRRNFLCAEHFHPKSWDFHQLTAVFREVHLKNCS